MKNQIYTIATILMGLVLNTSWAQDIDPDSDRSVQPGSPTTVNGYRLAWSDEFNGSAIDETKWIYRQGDDSRTFVKSYQSAANNSVSNGTYNCILKKESLGTKEFTAGGLISQKRMRYGYYESRFKCPPTGGWHTSFWMMGYGYSGTPHLELDVFENDSIDLYDYSVNVHRWRPEPHVTFGTKKVYTPSLSDNFHVLGCEFTPEWIRYFFNGELVQEVDATQFDHNDMNIWLTSLGLVYDHQPPIDESQLPVEAQYDYVRYFELGAHATVEITSPDGGATLTDINTSVGLVANVTVLNTNVEPTVFWTKVSGAGDVEFVDAFSSNTGARFSADGFYELACTAVIGNVTNTDSILISVNQPVSITLQHGVNGYDNPCAFIRGDYPDVNSGADNEMIIGHWGDAGLRGLLEFDLSMLDSNALIHAAELKLYNYNGVGTVGTMELRELSSSFVEGTGNGNGWSDGNGTGTGASWTSRTGSENWVTAGGDYLPTVLSSTPGYDATVAGYKTLPTSSAFVSSVQDALDTGTPLNLMVSSPATEAGASGNMSRIRSDDASTANERPALTISYLGNYLPEIDAGLNRAGWVGAPINLGGSVDHAEGVEWSQINGAGMIDFFDSSSVTSSATFPRPGKYWLRLSGSNALGTAYSDVSVSIVDTNPAFVGGTFVDGSLVFEVSTTTGLTYSLQSSTNLAGHWMDLYTTNSMLDPMFLEAPVSTNKAEFYRVILKP